MTTITLQEASNRALETHWANTRNYASIKSNLKSLMAHFGAERKVSTIGDREVGRFVQTLKADGAAPATVNRKLSALQTLLRFAGEEMDVKVQSPRFRKVRERERNGRIRVFTDTEERQMIESTRIIDADVSEFITVLFDTGMRLSEGLRLESRDIDFNTGMMSIWTTKNDVPRSIPMTGRVRQIMERRTNGRIFHLSANRVKYVWRLARKQAGLSHDTEVVIHAIRHTVASRLVQGGVPLYTVQRWMGHSTIKVTERYAHLSPAQFVEAVNVLDRAEFIPPSYKPHA
jgi:integrase